MKGRALPVSTTMMTIHKLTRRSFPYLPEKLSSLSVLHCDRLKMIENKAPNVSSFCLGGCEAKFSLVEISQMKKLDMLRNNSVCYARRKLPSQMPNLETLVIASDREFNVSASPVMWHKPDVKD
ncbi:hypothetical protein PR202_ga30890 [Eleusine coracana subsp. coracana]|uniref:At1g61320/AtMIF1 LRR domain-containing protein n=1 Tax=Eleusine coracana subsp. coracana TaxID=191504 RepID=A0AAV5DQA6_ELECO|nr:hypothetical protein PR202_ga30890 [Eleusine coracana subsp. coracana]